MNNLYLSKIQDVISIDNMKEFLKENQTQMTEFFKVLKESKLDVFTNPGLFKAHQRAIIISGIALLTGLLVVGLISYKGYKIYENRVLAKIKAAADAKAEKELKEAEEKQKAVEDALKAEELKAAEDALKAEELKAAEEKQKAVEDALFKATEELKAKAAEELKVQEVEKLNSLKDFLKDKDYIIEEKGDNDFDATKKLGIYTFKIILKLDPKHYNALELLHIYVREPRSYNARIMKNCIFKSYDEMIKKIKIEVKELTYLLELSINEDKIALNLLIQELESCINKLNTLSRSISAILVGISSYDLNIAISDAKNTINKTERFLNSRTIAEIGVNNSYLISAVDASIVTLNNILTAAESVENLNAEKAKLLKVEEEELINMVNTIVRNSVNEAIAKLKASEQLQSEEEAKAAEELKAQEAATLAQQEEAAALAQQELAQQEAADGLKVSQDILEQKVAEELKAQKAAEELSGEDAKAQQEEAALAVEDALKGKSAKEAAEKEEMQAYHEELNKLSRSINSILTGISTDDLNTAVAAGKDTIKKTQKLIQSHIGESSVNNSFIIGAANDSIETLSRILRPAEAILQQAADALKAAIEQKRISALKESFNNECKRVNNKTYSDITFKEKYNLLSKLISWISADHNVQFGNKDCKKLQDILASKKCKIIHSIADELRSINRNHFNINNSSLLAKLKNYVFINTEYNQTINLIKLCDQLLILINQKGELFASKQNKQDDQDKELAKQIKEILTGNSLSRNANGDVLSSVSKIMTALITIRETFKEELDYKPNITELNTANAVNLGLSIV